MVDKGSILDKGFTAFLASGLAYCGLMMGAYTATGPIFHEPIRSKKQLEQLIDEESVKLGLDDSKISFSFTPTVSFSKKSGEDEYFVNIERGSTKYVVKHELYHIKDGHCDQELGPVLFWPYYLFIAEPQAVIYQTFDLQL